MVSLFYLIIYMEAAKLCKQTAAAAAVCLHNLHNFAELPVKTLSIFASLGNEQAPRNR